MSGIVILDLASPPIVRAAKNRWRPIAVCLGVALCAMSGLFALQVLPAMAGGWDGWRTLTKSAGTKLLADAVPAGQEGTMTLFACRGLVGHDIHVGRIRADFGGCHIGFDGKEIEVQTYETLTVSWLADAPTSGSLLAGSSRAVSSEMPFDVTRVYACRAAYRGGVHPGQLVEGTKQCSFGFGGQRMVTSSYETIQMAPWLTWAAATARDIPNTAIVAGSEGGEPFYLCRAADSEGLHPGKVKHNSPGCSITSDGREQVAERFELLTSRWLPGRNGTIPVSAFPAGWESGRPQYVCRAQMRDGVEVGKVNEALNGCHVGMLGREVVVDDYQVLSQ